MEYLTQYAPFLFNYGHVILALFLGYMAARYLKNTPGKAASSEQSRSGKLGRGRPRDEDNYVFMEDTVITSSPHHVNKVNKEEEYEGIYNNNNNNMKNLYSALYNL